MWLALSKMLQECLDVKIYCKRRKRDDKKVCKISKRKVMLTKLFCICVFTCVWLKYRLVKCSFLFIVVSLCLIIIITSLYYAYNLLTFLFIRGYCVIGSSSALINNNIFSICLISNEMTQDGCKCTYKSCAAKN